MLFIKFTGERSSSFKASIPNITASIIMMSTVPGIDIIKDIYYV